MQRKRLKIIPDRIFHKLWNKAEEYSTAEEYINNSINDTRLFNYRNYGLDYPEYAGMLKNIYKLRHYDLKYISVSANKKKSELSHIFCIPIRTVEAWYSGINAMPSYILLMMLKQFHMLYLGKYIRLESEMEHNGTKPSVYSKRKIKTEPLEEAKPEKKSEFEEFMESEDYDEYLNRLIKKAKNRRHQADGGSGSVDM